MDLIIATHNPHKVREIRQILGDKFDNILSASQVGISSDVEETGETFYENARLKADFVKAQKKNCAVLSDDSGLCVDYLDGAPGVLSNRFFKEGDDRANRLHLLDVLKDAKDRQAHFETCVVFIDENGKVFSAVGKTEGRITFSESGNGGFGYDSVFFSNELGKTFGEASPEEKNSVSHRGRALNALCKMLENFE